MLIYDPSRDPYHAAVRVLSILHITDKPLELEAAQILDLLLLYPGLVVASKLPRNAARLKKMAAERQSPFRQAPSGRAIIDAIKAIQQAAAATLASVNVLSSDSLKKRVLARTSVALPPALASAVEMFLMKDSEYRNLLVQQLGEIQLIGKDGLKARTGLAEYRYDTI